MAWTTNRWAAGALAALACLLLVAVPAAGTSLHPPLATCSYGPRQAND